MLTLTCGYCKQPFEKFPAYLKRGAKLNIHEGQFCSMKCYGSYRAAKTPKTKIKCKSCKGYFLMRSSDFEYKKKIGTTPSYCSRKCVGLSKKPTVGVRYLRGYKFVYAKDNPDAKKNNYIAEHRLVMANHLGRRLTQDEVVHHLNGDKLDNRVENLVVTNRLDHYKIHNDMHQAKLKAYWTDERREVYRKNMKAKWAFLKANGF